MTCLTLLLTACETRTKNRPPGYLNLGPVKNLLAPETELPDFKLLLRRDKDGLYIMSTMCTYDLTYLKRKQVDGQTLYVSEYTDSKYDLQGNVVSGPAIAALPYYQLKLDAGEYGGPKDTLYVYIGKTVPPEWRLNLQIVTPTPG